MADPEQMYQEVLEEERKKGVSPAVAEGRAKAARVRAELGSPHPKEPKWWPGAQPHLEGEGAGGEAPPQPAAEEAPEAPAEPAPQAPAEPAPAQPAPEEPEEAAAEPAPAQPAPEEPEEAPAQPAPAQPAPAEEPAQPAAQPPAQPAAQPPARPPGVTHGTATGTRLRPEDAVGTEAAFEGQQAMYQRRKLIDDLLATGVPEVTAAETGPRGGLLLALMYIAIPLIAIFVLAAQDDGAGEERTANQSGGAPNVDVTLVAEAVSWDTDEITLPAGGATVAIDNQDSVEHNLALYENEQDADDQANALVDTPNVAGGESAEFSVEVEDPGEYVFQCDIHPAMRGVATVE